MPFASAIFYLRYFRFQRLDRFDCFTFLARGCLRKIANKSDCHTIIYKSD